MQWNEEYAIHQDAVDGDHKRLFELYNRFSIAHSTGASDETVAQFLNDLVDYSELHFRREEGLMKAAAYPDFAKHQGMHATFATYVRKLAGEIPLASEDIDFLLRYIEMWLCGHILVMDKWFGEWLTEQAAINRAGIPAR